MKVRHWRGAGGGGRGGEGGRREGGKGGGHSGQKEIFPEGGIDQMY